MAFRGGGDAGGGVSSREVKYERQIPKFLQKYKHMMTSGSFQQEARQAWEEYAPQMRSVVEDGADRDDELPTIVEADAMGFVADKNSDSSAAGGSGMGRRAGLGSSEAKFEKDFELKSRIEKLKTAGNEAFAEGKHEIAIQSFSDAIQLDPQNHILLSNRSAVYCSSKDYDKALQDAKKCVSLKKDWWKGFARKGAAYVGLQFWDEAVEAYREALALNPENENTRSALQKAIQSKTEEERLGKHVYRRKRRPSEGAQEARKSSKKMQESASKSNRDSADKKVMLSFDYEEEEEEE